VEAREARQGEGLGLTRRVGLSGRGRAGTTEGAMKIRRILVATDFSPNAQAAVEYAYAIAEQLCAELMVVHVLEASPLRTAIQEGLMTEGSTNESIAAAVEQLIASRFAEALAGLPRNGLAIATVVRRGEPDAEIAACVRSLEADLLVMGMAGRSVMETARTTVVGSVTRSLLRTSACPALVVRPEHGRHLRLETL
jgi:nucleotide-binding universal stress UspA family protein